ncbi:MAG: hypothetical protein Q7S09_03685 [bacterium]|nr:hypothetical protein [bacterium]
MNEFLSRRFCSALLPVAALAVGFIFITPNLVAWWRIDNFQIPFRAVGGDDIHYLTNLHRLQVEGVSGSSMFTWEHRADGARFPFFDAIIKYVPGFAGIPIIWLQVLLRFISVVAVFLAFYGLFRAVCAEIKLSFSLALATTFLYSPYAIQGPGLNSWFLSFFLAGLVPFMFTAIRRPYSFATLSTSILFVFLSAMHPVFLITAICMTGLWWFAGLWQKRREARIWLYAFAWLAASCVVGRMLLGSHLNDFFNATAGSAVSGFFERNSGIHIRIPLFPLVLARFVLLALALWVGYRRGRTETDAGRGRAWLLLLFLSVPTILANVQNAFTGFAFIGGHFVILEEFIVLPAVALVLFASNTETFRGSRLQKILGIILFMITAIFLFSLTINRPIRSWLVLGRWVPLFIGYLILCLWLVFPGRLRLLASKTLKLLPALLVFSLVYAGFFLWRFYRYDAPTHVEAQQYRQIYDRLSQLAPGVVMAPPSMSEHIALYTPQRVYWSHTNGQFGGTYEELADRLLDERLVFENNSQLGSDYGRISAFGTFNYWCGMLTETAFYAKMRLLGIADVTTCDVNDRSEREWPKYLAQFTSERDAISQGAPWTPRYRLDWLVVHEGQDRISSSILRRYFEKAESVGSFTIYKYRESAL